MNPRQLVAGMAIAASMIVLAGCSGEGAAEEPEPSPATTSATPTLSPTPSALPITVSGAVVEGQPKNVAEPGTPCKGKVAAGDEIVATDLDQNPLGVAKLAGGETGLGTCEFGFEIDVVGGSGPVQLWLLKQAISSGQLDRDGIEDKNINFTMPQTLSADEKAYIAADAKANGKSDDANFTLQGGYGTCASLADFKGDELVAYIVEADASDLAIKHLCPKYQKAAARAAKSFGEGSFTVGKNAEIKPGTYNTLPGVKDCYWERMDDRGNTRSNELVSFAPKGVRITLLETGGGFKSERCGVWVWQ